MTKDYRNFHPYYRVPSLYVEGGLDLNIPEVALIKEWSFYPFYTGTPVEVYWLYDCKGICLHAGNPSSEVNDALNEYLHQFTYDVIPHCITIHGIALGKDFDNPESPYPNTFLVYDAQLGDQWMSQQYVKDITNKLGMNYLAPVLKKLPPNPYGENRSGWAYEMNSYMFDNSYEENDYEGFIGRPKGYDLFTATGERVMFKYTYEHHKALHLMLSSM